MTVGSRYASSADYAEHLGVDVAVVEQDPRAGSALASADDVVANLTLTAVYATDADDLPTDPRVRTAFTRAVCAQAQWFSETGDTTGAASVYSLMGIGSLTLAGKSTRDSVDAAQVSRIAPAAVQILHTAGLLTQAPV